MAGHWQAGQQRFSETEAEMNEGGEGEGGGG